MKADYKKLPKPHSIVAVKPKPATKKAVDKALKEGMKLYRNTLKALATS